MVYIYCITHFFIFNKLNKLILKEYFLFPGRSVFQQIGESHT